MYCIGLKDARPQKAEVPPLPAEAPGTGKPGALSKKLIEEYHALTKVSGEPI